MISISIVVPTFNGGELWRESARRLASQRFEATLDQIIIIDSSSTDDTRATARALGFDVSMIDQKDFDHGGTRSKALEQVTSDVIVFLTQDALLNTDDSIAKLISAFNGSPEVVCAYGRQLPHIDANPLAQHARFNSYRNTSYVTGLEDDFPVGFRKAFLSNSFAAYRVDFLKSKGVFPEHMILGEDYFVS